MGSASETHHRAIHSVINDGFHFVQAILRLPLCFSDDLTRRANHVTFAMPCPVLRAKIFVLLISANQKYGLRRPASLEEGVMADRHRTRARDAMDALASRVRFAHADERCSGRRLKSCGPVAPTLAISRADDVSAMMGARKPGSQGDHV